MRIIILLVTVVALVACGGGGGDSAKPPSAELPPQEKPVELAFGEPAIYPVGGEPRQILVFDFDGDGSLDVIVATGASQSITVLLNDGTGSLSSPVSYPAGGHVGRIASGDFDGDGVADIVASLTPKEIAVMLGQLSGGLSAPSISALSSWATGLAVGDFDLDGLDDYVVVQHIQSGGEVFLSQGNGLFASAGRYKAGLQPLSVMVADVNSDNLPDVVAWSNIVPSVDILFGNGNGTFQEVVTTPRVGSGSNFVATNMRACELNGDEHLDLLVNASSSRLDVLHGNSDGTFTNWPFQVQGNVYDAACADMDGDGHVDIVAATRDRNVVTIVPNDGSGRFPIWHDGWSDGGHLSFDAGASPQYLAVADLNGDGLPDIVASSPLSGTVAVLFNESAKPE